MAKEVVITAKDVKSGKIDLATKSTTELVDLINTLTAELTVRTGKYLEKGNKSAGKDARKITLALDLVFKAFRKASV